MIITASEATQARYSFTVQKVRHHGVYIWGKDWIQAKTQAECYDYLFEIAVKMAGMGMDASRPPAPLLANGAANGETQLFGVVYSALTLVSSS